MDHCGVIMAKRKSVRFSLWHLAWIIPSGVIGLLAVVLFVIPEPNFADGFRTLDEVTEYANGLDEWVEMENDNVAYPSYAKYFNHKFNNSIKIKLVQKIKRILNPFTRNVAAGTLLKTFEQFLKTTIHTRITKKLSGDFIQKIESNTETTLIVFGPLYGAFHTLARSLNELKRMNLIDNSFKLKNKNTFIFFLGYAATKSPFCLETFLTILQLMQSNPDQIIYLRGKQEIASHWKQQPLRQELEIGCSYEALDFAYLATNVNRFFDTLPLATYCTFFDLQNIAYIKLTHSAVKEGTLDLEDLQLKTSSVNFLATMSNHVIATQDLNDQKLDAKNPNTPSLIMKALICDIAKRDNFQKTPGLLLWAPLNGVTRWWPLSGPISPARQHFDFYNDAFTLIKPMTTLSKWSISLYSRDIRSEDKIFSVNHYDLFSGNTIASNKP